MKNKTLITILGMVATATVLTVTVITNAKDEHAGNIMATTDSVGKDEKIYLPYNENDKGQKSYSSYTAITDNSTEQWELQNIANTDKDGFRKVNNRYMIVVGEWFDFKVGEYVTVELENGETIDCIVGDINGQTKDGIFSNCECAVSFICDYEIVKDKTFGDITSIIPQWKSRVFSIKRVAE